MKTFTHLIQEVQDKGRCHHCGGCFAFCTAINYGALELAEDGKPRYRDQSKCIECGICYAICPEVGELNDEVKKLVSWTPPIGQVLGTVVARAVDPEVQARGTDGGVVTALLLYLLDQGRIDGAIVSKKMGPFQRQPWLARTREEILEAAGFHFDTLATLSHFSQTYSTYSPSIVELKAVTQKRHNRVAFVGTPCQINSLRRMEVLGVVPSEAIRIHFGLFCAGNFQFGEGERKELEKLGNFQWTEVLKVNLKEELMIHLHKGEVRRLPLERLGFMKRHACQFCVDYAAEYADLSFGGLGAPEGWTTVIIRSIQGHTLLSKARGAYLELFPHKEDPRISQAALAKITEWSGKKKAMAGQHLEELYRQAV
jgi:coenzyme F420 hydrogenase subunit beta